MNETNEIKSRILKEAKEKFSRYGFNNVTTDELAKDLGISKRTLYRYFPSKTKLYEELIMGEIDSNRKMAAEVMERMVNEEDYDFLEEADKLFNIMKEAISCFKTNYYRDLRTTLPGLHQKVMDYRKKHVKHIYREVLNAGIKKGIIKDTVNSELMYILQSSFLLYVLDPEVLAELPYTSEEIVSNVNDIFLTGILTEEARKKFNSKKHQSNSEKGM